MKLFGKMMAVAALLWLLALAAGCAKPDQPGDTGGDDKSRNDLLR